MDNAYTPYLSSIRGQAESMTYQLIRWVNQNSGSESLDNLRQMQTILQHDFATLQGQIEVIPLPPRHTVNSMGELLTQPTASALRIKKRATAPIQVFLGGHYDTVYSAASPFQKAEWLNPQTLRGPGTADMKGGLAIMLKALEAFETCPWAEQVGWEIVLNPDEEVGSMSSESLFSEGAQRANVGLIFEPAFPDGAFVSARKGSYNLTLVARGKAAHVGRDFFSGRNAITALARIIAKLDLLNDAEAGLILNIGHIEGGGPSNIVPNLATCKINFRTETSHQTQTIREELSQLIQEEHRKEGLAISAYPLAERQPKPFNDAAEKLFNNFKHCGNELGIDLSWRPTGGVCDGNILAGAGLPTIDTLGAVGGNIHTADEFILVDSLTERACLTNLFLMKLARGEISL